MAMTTITCPNCGCEVPEDRGNCGACGHAMPHRVDAQPAPKAKNLVTCKDCGASISRNAESCPSCGAPNKSKPKQYGCGTLIALFIVGLVMFAAIKDAIKPTPIAPPPLPSEMQSSAPPPPKKSEPTPEQRAAAEEATARAAGLRWVYYDSPDKMTGKSWRFAEIKSVNLVDFDFPYQGSQRATLTLRSHPTKGRDVIISLERAQFLCGTSGCSVGAKFDAAAPVKYAVSEPADHRSNMLFIDSDEQFVKRLRSSKTVMIEAQFYQQGSRVFEFQSAGLEWK